MGETISGHGAEALRENVGITQTGRAAAVLIAVPVSMEGLLCLLPDLLRHVCLEHTSELSHGTSELHRQDDMRLVSTALC